MKGNFNRKIVFKVFSNILFISAAAQLSCLFVALIYHEQLIPFLDSSAIALVCGFLFLLLSGPRQNDFVIRQKEAYLTVTLSWVLLGILGMLPYMLSKSIPQPINAFFESVSGFTTTGSSILTNIESLPKSILFWRSLTHWIGGIGIIVIVIVVMPALHSGGYHLFTLESSLQEKIQPRIKKVGYRLLQIYLLLTLLEVVFLLLGKMSLYDSLCHAFATVATGGFSTKNTSISEFSPYIQYTITLFMLLAGVNFVIHYYLLKRDFKKLKNNEELRFYLAVTGILVFLVTTAVFRGRTMSLETAFRHALFQVVSTITCTGFATADYLEWPTTAWVIIVFSMFLGGSAGSTAGGIKIVRHLILLKNIKRVFKQSMSPNAIIPLKLNKRVFNEDANRTVITFVTVYIVVFVIGTLLMLLLGIDGKTASSSVATCMAGIGPGIGTVGPASNFAHLPETAKMLLSVLMIMGRLEIYTVLLLFTRSFWNK